MNKASALYLVILAIASIGSLAFIGPHGYMLMPALSAIIIRYFFYDKRFQDANLHLGEAKDYFSAFSVGLLVTGSSYAMATLKWDLALKDLICLDIFSRLIYAFGEEFGWRGLFYPQLLKGGAWPGYIIGGLIWFLWRMPILTGHAKAYILILAPYTILFGIYLTYVYVKSQSIFVTAFANGIIGSPGHLAKFKDPLGVAMGYTLLMAGIVVYLHSSKKLASVEDVFCSVSAQSGLPCLACHVFHRSVEKKYIRALLKGGAVDEDGAKTLEELGLESSFLLEGLVERGVVTSSVDGRYYLTHGEALDDPAEG
jgi:membrane protease YdiL (CAAX protease family)